MCAVFIVIIETMLVPCGVQSRLWVPLTRPRYSELRRAFQNRTIKLQMINPLITTEARGGGRFVLVITSQR